MSYFDDAELKRAIKLLSPSTSNIKKLSKDKLIEIFNSSDMSSITINDYLSIFLCSSLSKILSRLRLKNKSSYKKDEMISLIGSYLSNRVDSIELLNGDTINVNDDLITVFKKILSIDALKSSKNNPVHLIKYNDLKKLASKVGVKEYYYLSKDELIKAIKEKDPSKTLEELNAEHILSKEFNVISNIDKVYNLSSDKDIDYIIHLADIHIRYTTKNSGLDRYTEYYNVFNNLIADLRLITGNCIIVICGDIFHYKTTQKASSLKLWNYLLHELTNIFPVIAITGNHDYDMETNNLDWLESSYECNNFYHLNTTGVHVFNNIIFGVSALKDDCVYNMKKLDPKYKYVQLYHGTMNGSVLFNDNTINNNINIDSFGEFDLLLLGDIHKHQMLKSNVAYSGSLIQQNIGESIYNHGYILWDMSTFTGVHKEINNDYCFLKVYIDDELRYDNSIIGNKSNLYVIYEMYNNDYEMVQEFENLMSLHNIDIISRRYRNHYNNVSKVDTSEIFIDKTSVEYFNMILDDLEYDNKDNILSIHKDITSKVDTVDSFISKWCIDWLEFKNVFCYGNDIVNNISLDYSGLYKIFGDNFTGKSSIFNIIKWILFGSSSNVNEKDILNSSSSSGYIRCSINGKYILSKSISIDNSLKSGVRIKYELVDISISDKSIVGKTEINNILSKVIGSYNEFELISSINNNDIGILVNNPYPIFKDLYKLDRFDDYILESKNILKDLKLKITDLNNKLCSYDKNSPNRLNLLRKSLYEYENELSSIELYDEDDLSNLIFECKYKKMSPLYKIEDNLIDKSSDIESLKVKLQSINIDYDEKELFNLRNMCNITLLPESDEYKDCIDEINYLECDISNYLRELGLSNINDLHKKNKYIDDKYISDSIGIKDIDDNELFQYLNKYRDDYKLVECNIKKCNDDLSKYKSNMFKSSSYSLEKLNDMLISYGDIISNKMDSINVNENSLVEHRLIIQDNLTKIIVINYSKDELESLIRGQGFNYETMKSNIIRKINSNTITQSDYQSILTLINEINYQSLLSQLVSNETYRSDNKILTNKIKSIQNLINNEKNEINVIKNKVSNIEKRIIELKKNNELELKIKDKLSELSLYKNKLSELDNKIKTIETHININYNNKLYCVIDKVKNLTKLKNEYKQYNIYKSNKEINLKSIKNRDMYMSRLSLMESYKNIYSQLSLLEDLQNKYVTNQNNILLNRANELSNKEYLMLKERVDNITMSNSIKNQNIDHLSNLISSTQSEIIKLVEDIELNEAYMCELVMLEKQVEEYKLYKDIMSNNNIKNKIMHDKLMQLRVQINSILTKYTNFSIDIEYNNANKIIIYQIKQGKRISINSCSGYETMILNISCKIALKKYSSINQSNMIMIDEVMSCISNDNYHVIEQLINIMSEYYSNIFIITHINEIKDMLIDNGKYINIKKEGDYSVIV